MPELRAAVPFYGPHPPVEDVPNIQAAVLAIYAGNDQRINQGIPRHRRSHAANNKIYEKIIYPDVDHAFHNDTGTPLQRRCRPGRLEQDAGVVWEVPDLTKKFSANAENFFIERLWARQGSNLRPSGYEPRALPLSYGPGLAARHCLTISLSIRRWYPQSILWLLLTGQTPRISGRVRAGDGPLNLHECQLGRLMPYHLATPARLGWRPILYTKLSWR